MALANHLVMGPVILARALGGATPYAVKVHGSALEYTVRPHRERFLPYALEGLRGASAVLVGSRHTAESLWEVVAEPGLRERTRLGPPGVDIHTFSPRPPAEAAAGLSRLSERVESADAAALGRRGGRRRGARLARPEPRPDRQLRGQADRLEGRGPAAGRLAAGGGAGSRGAPRDRGLRHLPRGARDASWTRSARGDVDALREIAARGRELEGGPPGALSYLTAFLDRVDDDWRRGGAARPPSGSTSPGASSTTTCPTCCPPARRR